MKTFKTLALSGIALCVSAVAQEAYPERIESTKVASGQIIRLRINAPSKTLMVSSIESPLRTFDLGALTERGQLGVTGNDRISAFAASFSGKTLAVGYTNGAIKTFASLGFSPGISFSPHRGFVSAIAIHEEKYVFSAGADRKVAISDLQNGAELGSIQLSPLEPTDVLPHPDGRQFVVSLANGTYQFYALTGLKPGIAISTGTTRTPTAQFSTDGSLLAVGTSDGRVLVYQASDGKQVTTLAVHKLSVSSVAFSPSMTWMVSVSADSTLAIVDVASMKIAKVLRSEGASWTQAVFAPEDVLIVSTADGSLERWIIKKTPPDVDPPVIVLETPTPRPAGIPHRLYARELELKFVIWDNVKLGSATVNGKPVQLTPLGSTDTVRVPAGAVSGKFVARVKLDTIGRNTFTIGAVDAIGLSTSRTVLVERLSSNDALEILAPEGKEEVDMVNIPIQFRAWFNVRSFSVSNNLTPIIRDKQVKGKFSGDVITEEIPLVAGYNQVQLDVTGASGEKISRTIGVTRKYTATVVQAPKPSAAKRSPTSGPQKWAVIVGVSQYANPAIPSLKFADKDAEAFANFLRTPQGGGYDNDHMRVLLNDKATFPALRDALMDFLSSAIDMDLVMIYFAGHGMPDPARPQNLFLLTHDTDPNKLNTTSFPMWQIQDVLARYISAKRIVVFSDACHSGGISVNFATRGVGVTEQNLVNQYLADLSRSKEGTVVFTASAAGEVSQEFPEFGHGVFTFYLLEGLRGKADYNNDYTITINEAMQYTEENVKRKTRGSQNPTRSQTDYDKELTVSLIEH